MTDDKNLAMKELDEVLEDLVTLLKHPEVCSVLNARGVNSSLAIVAAEGLKTYVEGHLARAAEDFDTVAEEITTRLERRDKPPLAAEHTTDGQTKKDGS
jgi:hypothetical protein